MSLIDETHTPARKSWVAGADAHPSGCADADGRPRLGPRARSGSRAGAHGGGRRARAFADDGARAAPDLAGRRAAALETVESQFGHPHAMRDRRKPSAHEKEPNA